MPRLLPTAALALALAAEASAQTPPACLGEAYRAGRTNMPDRASGETGARLAWSELVARRRGLIWSNWINATDRTMTCNQYTTWTGANAWTCWAQARPCYLQ